MNRMTPESWLVVTVAAAFLLVGVAVSPLAWMALQHRRSQLEARMEVRWLELTDKVRALEERLTESRVLSPGIRTGNGELAPSHAAAQRRHGGSRSGNGTRQEHAHVAERDAHLEPALIAVPSLAAAPNHSEESVSGLTDRFAAIWTLAENGDSPEEIAQATGQPIGQIDLILGLRRQIDRARTTIPHSPHG
jgi:hypothetical protein